MTSSHRRWADRAKLPRKARRRNLQGSERGRMPEDSTQNLNDPLDTKPLIEQLAREMVATREMLLARFDRVEDRLSAMESEIVTLNQQAKETNVRLAEMNERFGAIAED